MFCPYCGKENQAGNRYCLACGKELPAGQTQPEEKAETVVQMAQEEKKRPTMSAKSKKKLIIGGIAAAVLLVLVAVGIVAVRQAVNPENVIEAYLQARIGGDWEKLYDCMDIPEGEALLSKEKFVEQMEANYGVDGEEYDELTEIKDIEEVGEAESSVRHFAVTWETSEHETYDSSVTLVQQEEKTMGLFPTYKVSSEDLICEPVVETREGASVKIDGEIVPEGTINEYGYYEVTLPKVFAGSHTITVEYPYCQPIENIEYLYNGQELQYDDFILSEECTEQLEEEMLQLAETVYAALNHKTEIEEADFSARFTDEAFEELETVYESSLDDFYGYKNYTTTDILVEDMWLSNYSDEIPLSDEQYVYMSVEVNYSYSQAYKKEEAVEYDGMSWVSVDYQLIDGEWVITAVYSI